MDPTLFIRRPAFDLHRSLRWCLGILLAWALAGCAVAPLTTTQQVAELSRLVKDNDLDGAVALIEQYPGELDDRRGLSVAVRVGNPEAVRFFAKRVGVDAPLDLDDTTALIDSITRAPPASRTHVARALLEMGADPYIEDKFGRSAESLAERRNERELLEIMNRRGGSAQSQPPSRMLSWLADGKRATTLLASNSLGDVAARRGRLAQPKAGLADVPSKPAFLMQAIWLPANPSGNASLAAFRFHADGRGELLRYAVRDKRSETVPGAQVAWEFEGGRLRFFVLSEQFSALCESSTVSSKRLAITCTDYSRAVPAQKVAGGEAGFDNARVLLDQPRVEPPRAGLRQTVRSSTELVAGAQPGCRPKAGAQRVVAGSVRGTSLAGDWYAINQATREIFAPLSGMACRPAEAERAALQACLRSGKGACRSVAGCPAGQVSAVATLPGHAGLWVGCDIGLQQARRKALEACQASAGCDCSLIAVSGQNVNIARQPACGR
ncbi:MAG: DUF4189 domain-containing protein [Burkholderiaceae bacterium]